jgi:hypothetical protein
MIIVHGHGHSTAWNTYLFLNALMIQACSGGLHKWFSGRVSLGQQYAKFDLGQYQNIHGGVGCQDYKYRSMAHLKAVQYQTEEDVPGFGYF